MASIIRSIPGGHIKLPDNVRIYLGDGSTLQGAGDASLYWDGTKLVIGGSSGMNLTTAGLVEGSNAGITLTGEIIGVPRVTSVDFAFDDTSVVLATIPDGEVWLIHEVFVTTATDWDGNGLATIGDGNDPDGFLACSNASLDPAYDETGGLTGWTAGSVGLYQQNRGVYLFEGTNDAGLLFRYAPSGAAETIDITVTQGTSTQGASTAHVRYTRIA